MKKEPDLPKLIEKFNEGRKIKLSFQSGEYETPRYKRNKDFGRGIVAYRKVYYGDRQGEFVITGAFIGDQERVQTYILEQEEFEKQLEQCLGIHKGFEQETLF